MAMGATTNMEASLPHITISKARLSRPPIFKKTDKSEVSGARAPRAVAA